MTTAKERPILFSGAMVRATLAGKKSQTRRVVNGWREFHACLTGDCPHENGKDCQIELVKECPHGQTGDLLWVRETWCCKMDDGEFIYRPDGNHDCHYAADGYEVLKDDGDGFHEVRRDGRMASPWRPSIFMPRWASRITLEITGVRVERVQEISERDAIAEGVSPCGHDSFHTDQHTCAFKELWDSINGKKHPWDSNCWVWVIEFRRVES